MDNEQREIILGFVEEGRDMIDEAEPLLVDLESYADHAGEVDSEIINTIFRLFHSLKGGAGFLDFSNVSHVTHEAETLLDLFRKGQGRIRSDHVDLLTTACDFIRTIFDQIETTFVDTGFEEEAEQLRKDINEKILEIQSGDAEPDDDLEDVSQQEEAVEEEPLSIDFGEFEQDESEVEEEAEVEEETEYEEPPEVVETKRETPKPRIDMGMLTQTPEMVKAFVQEAEELLETIEQALLSLENDPNNDEHINSVFRGFHSLKGNSGFLGYSDFEKLAHQSETILDKIRSGVAIIDSKLLSLLLEIIDFFRGGLSNLNEGRPPRIPAASGLISLLNDTLVIVDSDAVKAPEEIKPAEKPVTKEPAPEPPKPAIEKVEAKPAASKAEVAKPKEEPKTPKPAPAPKTAQKPAEKGPAPKAAAAQRQSIRVDVEKLDVLLDLIGELVITEAMVAQNPDIKALNVTLERFERSVMHLDKLTRELQDVATSIRMIPLASTFRRMIRLVRDLSHKAGKKVDLHIVGEDTEVDKTVIEQISDPLVHIIRNSIDHGLETPDERKKTEKNPTGIVTLEAKYVGGEVWIEISDDGRGLNRDKILSRAIERGLVKGDGSDLRDDEVWNIIFQPGFSTAAQITDISGRGVGMDVVRRNIENIRGKVDVRSTTGAGTTVILRIPLTLAIIDGMLIRIDQSKYVVPLVTIRESFQTTSREVTTLMDGQEVVRVRNDLIPVVRLGDYFGISNASKELWDGILMLVEHDGRQVALLVDEILGQQQVVIKGLSDYIGKAGDIQGISGCTILGDGTISLILDIQGLIDSVETEENSEIDIAN